jgi:diaminohydroxyphosphoribosylaminopyrimidine deaminase / 5-amino-6-(5-phosphoribosylamino)uracil reductase
MTRFTANDEKWMGQALELARRSEGLASPNPVTGAVVVRGDSVLGEGFHRYADRRHAEVVAIERAGRAARGATLYVNLEPCCHTGRTPPCTQAIAAAGIRRVVAAMRDPNPRVAGGGLRQLRAAGIEVSEGVCEKQARRLNEGFARWITSGRPWVTLKSAATLDGQLALSHQGRRRGARRAGSSGPARRAGSTTWLTSEQSRAEVHRMRHASDALLTGIGTVLADDPLLTDRSGLPRRRPLLRVILDARLRLPLESQIVRSANSDVLVFTAVAEDLLRARQLRGAGVEIVSLPSPGSFPAKGHLDLRAVVRELGRRQILAVILEAGSELNGAALEAGIVDKIVLFYAPIIAGSPAVPFARAALKQDRFPLWELNVERFGPDLRVEGYLRDPYRK